jgi:hypothetical protein
MMHTCQVMHITEQVMSQTTYLCIVSSLVHSPGHYLLSFSKPSLSNKVNQGCSNINDECQLKS